MKIAVCNHCKSEFEVKTNREVKDRKFCGSSCSNKSRAVYAHLSKAEYDKIYREKNIDKLTEQGKIAVHARFALLGDSYKKSMLHRAKARAKAQDVPFELSIEDVDIPERCPVLDIELQYNNGQQGGSDNSPSLNKIDPSKGYVKGNVIVVSGLANRIKTNATLDQIKQVYDFYSQFPHFQYTQGLTLKDLQNGKTIK